MIACNGFGLSCQAGCMSVNVHGLSYITLWIADEIKGGPVDMLHGGVRLFFSLHYSGVEYVERLYF